MRIIPEPPETHKLMSPAGKRFADELWWIIHALAFTLVAGAAGVVVAVVLLLMK